MIPQKHHDKDPVYFSLQRPIFRTYQDLARKKATLISKLENIRLVLNKYAALFSSNHLNRSDTIIKVQGLENQMK